MRRNGSQKNCLRMRGGVSGKSDRLRFKSKRYDGHAGCAFRTSGKCECLRRSGGRPWLRVSEGRALPQCSLEKSKKTVTVCLYSGDGRLKQSHRRRKETCLPDAEGGRCSTPYRSRSVRSDPGTGMRRLRSNLRLFF